MIKYVTDNWPISLLWRVVVWLEENYGSSNPAVWAIDEDYILYIAEDYNLFFLLAFSKFIDTCRI